MRIGKQYIIWTGLLLLAAGQTPCFAVTTDELKALMDQEAAITIIDARTRAEFFRGHILNAINIPGDILKNKTLPPVGKVVVYGDGLQEAALRSAVEALNLQQGIAADLLQGGYPAWAGQTQYTMPQFGLKKDVFTSITYQELKKADHAADQHITIIDLRNAAHTSKTDRTPTDNDQSETPIANLEDIFPALTIIQPDVRFSAGTGANKPDSISGLSSIQKQKTDQLYVLIDLGDGTSQKVARRLSAKGIYQTAILIGGEKMIQRKGEPGIDSKMSGF